MSNGIQGGDVKEAEKIWEKAWNGNEMRSYSTSWSLAGDAGVFNLIQSFNSLLYSTKLYFKS